MTKKENFIYILDSNDPDKSGLDAINRNHIVRIKHHIIEHDNGVKVTCIKIFLVTGEQVIAYTGTKESRIKLWSEITESNSVK